MIKYRLTKKTGHTSFKLCDLRLNANDTTLSTSWVYYKEWSLNLVVLLSEFSSLNLGPIISCLDRQIFFESRMWNPFRDPSQGFVVSLIVHCTGSDQNLSLSLGYPFLSRALASL